MLARVTILAVGGSRHRDDKTIFSQGNNEEHDTMSCCLVQSPQPQMLVLSITTKVLMPGQTSRREFQLEHYDGRAGKGEGPGARSISKHITFVTGGVVRENVRGSSITYTACLSTWH